MFASLTFARTSIIEPRTRLTALVALLLASLGCQPESMTLNQQSDALVTTQENFNEADYLRSNGIEICQILHYEKSALPAVIFEQPTQRPQVPSLEALDSETREKVQRVAQSLLASLERSSPRCDQDNINQLVKAFTQAPFIGGTDEGSSPADPAEPSFGLSSNVFSGCFTRAGGGGNVIFAHISKGINRIVVTGPHGQTLHVSENKPSEAGFLLQVATAAFCPL